MAKRHRRAVQKYHDRVAGTYDHSYDDAYWKWHDALTWDYLKPFLPRDACAEVVDFGCGTGKWGAKLAKSGYPVTSVDISHKMLDQARRKIEEVAGAGNAQFVQADLCDLTELPDSRYALAVALGDPIACTSNPAKALKEIRRVLIDGGILVATFDNRLAAIDYYLDRGDTKETAKFFRNGKTHWLTKNADEQFEIFTYTPSQLRDLVEGAGFSVVELVGKTILPMRKYRDLLSESADRRSWAIIEKTLCRDTAAIGRASHLQIVCRSRPRD